MSSSSTPRKIRSRSAGGHGTALTSFDVADGLLEIGFADLLAIDARHHGRQLRGHRLGCRRAPPVAAAEQDAAGVPCRPPWCRGRRPLGSAGAGLLRRGRLRARGKSENKDECENSKHESSYESHREAGDEGTDAAFGDNPEGSDVAGATWSNDAQPSTDVREAVRLRPFQTRVVSLAWQVFGGQHAPP